MTRLLWISEYPPTSGGIADYSMHVTNAIAEQGAEVAVLSPSGKSPKKTLHRNVTVVGEIPKTSAGWIRKVSSNYVGCVIQLPGVKLSGFTPAVPYLRLKQNIIGVLHEPPKEQVFRLTVTGFDKLVFLTEHARERFEGRYGIIRRITHTATDQLPYYGLDPTLPSRTRDVEINHFDNETNPLIVCPGFITKRKQFHLVLEALPPILQEEPSAHLVFAGGVHRDESNEYLKKLQDRVQKLNLNDAVTFAGLLEENEVNRWMQIADVCVFPYQDIFQSSVLAKCLALGTPAAVSNIPGLRVLTDEFGGTTFKNLTPTAIKDTVRECTQSNNNIDSERLIYDLSWDRNACRYLEIL